MWSERKWSTESSFEFQWVTEAGVTLSCLVKLLVREFIIIWVSLSWWCSLCRKTNCQVALLLVLSFFLWFSFVLILDWIWCQCCVVKFENFSSTSSFSHDMVIWYDGSWKFFCFSVIVSYSHRTCFYGSIELLAFAMTKCVFSLSLRSIPVSERINTPGKWLLIFWSPQSNLVVKFLGSFNRNLV